MPRRLQDMRDNKITTVDFSAESIKENDAQDIADALKSNTSLKEILLEYSDLTDSQFAIIHKALMMHEPLNFINLSCNLLTDSSVPHIIQLIEKRKAAEINIRGNEFSTQSIKSLEKAMAEADNAVKVTIAFSRKRKSSSEDELTFFKGPPEELTKLQILADSFKKLDKNSIMEVFSSLPQETLDQIQKAVDLKNSPKQEAEQPPSFPIQSY